MLEGNKQKNLFIPHITETDLNNLFSFDEYVIVEEDQSGMYIEMIRLSQQISTVKTGKFTILINENYLICFRSFKNYIKEIFLKHIKQNEKYYLSSEVELEDISRLGLLCKFILIFIPEFITLYNFKIKILEKIKLNEKYKIDEFSYLEILLNEFKFIHLINFANRKCCYSWFYRQTIFQELMEIFNKNKFDKDSKIIINDKILIENKIDKKEIFKLHSKINNFFMKLDLYENKNRNDDLINEFILFDILLLENINANEKRNYHLWKYILNISNYISSGIYFLNYLYFAISCFAANRKDYSSFSFIVNFFIGKISFEKINRIDNRFNLIFDDNRLKLLRNIVIDYFGLLSQTSDNWNMIDLEYVIKLISYLEQ